MIVVDANVVFEIVTAADGPSTLDGENAVAPLLLWPEVRSALHVALSRGLLDEDEASTARDVLERGVVGERRHRRLGSEAWRIADVLGWEKTYDAEYLALAYLLKAPIATFDRRVQRAAGRLGVATESLT